jgi:hypothetical protein
LIDYENMSQINVVLDDSNIETMSHFDFIQDNRSDDSKSETMSDNGKKFFKSDRFF